MIMHTAIKENTLLSPMQGELLKRIGGVLSFVADLVQGGASLWVKAKDSGYFLVLAQKRSHTVFSFWEERQEGTFVKKSEEPLVEETFREGKFLFGKRECEIGTRFLDMHTFPIKDEKEVVAVVVIHGDSKVTEGYTHLVKTVQELLMVARKGISEELYSPISPNGGIIVADGRRRIVYANMAARRIYRVLGVGSLVGMQLFDRQLRRYITCEVVTPNRPFEKEITAGELILLQREIELHEGGTLLRRIVIIEDVTESKKRDYESKVQSAVITEIHHRVKNNLQMVASLLRLQARRTNSEEAKAALIEGVNRIMSVSVVHEMMTKKPSELNVAEVTKCILELLQKSILPREFILEMEVTGEAILHTQRAAHLSLVINEIILNSLEHGFKGRMRGKIAVNIEKKNDGLYLSFIDDGIGLGNDFSLENTDTLGISIIKTLVEGDMKGSISFLSDGGTTVTLCLPSEEEGADE